MALTDDSQEMRRDHSHHGEHESAHAGPHHASHEGHAHGHHHHHAARFDTAFAVGIALNTAFVIAEVAVGARAHSLALVADAGHNLGDVLGLALAWGATALARRPATAQRTYGLRRASILAALANAAFLLAAVGAIIWEAVRRFREPAPIATGLVMVVAAIGIVINVGTALGFAAGRREDLNVRGAFLHMLGDAAASGGVIVAAAAIAFTGWLWLDPAVSLALALLIAVGTWGLLRDSVNLVLDAVPTGIDAAAVEAYLAALPGVTGVHDLHIWGMSTTHVALTAHLVRPAELNDDALIVDACRTLHAKFGIEHATLQVERGHGSEPCELARIGVI